MKKIFLTTITSMIILANVFAQDTKPIETLESKNEVCVVIDKTILRINYLKIYGMKILQESREWSTDFIILAEYYHYIAKNNRLGLGFGVNINPSFQYYDIYGVTKIKVPLSDIWFIGLGAGLGNVDAVNNPYKTNLHEFFKLFTCFNFKNISIYLSYTQDISYGHLNINGSNLTDLMATFKTYNLGIGTRFII
ncbi:MAG: hypothetical protein LBU10_01245 [Endomicrobium sp.]|jgi:hypothetical protein|nr:hypothetical protein [Endomicrobium sp.]